MTNAIRNRRSVHSPRWRAVAGARSERADRLRFGAESAEAAGAHPSRRGGRRGHEFEGQHLRVHAHRRRQCDLGRVAHVHPRRVAPVRVRPHRQVRARDRRGRVRLPVRAGGAGGCQGPYLGGGSRLQHGDRVRPGWPRGDDAGPQAGSGFRRAAAAVAAAVPTRARASPATTSTGLPMSPGMRRATSSSPMDTATRGSRSSIPTGTSSSPGARAGRGRASSICRFRSPPMRAATCTSPIAATSEFRSSTMKAPSSARSPMSARRWAICISPGAHQYLYSSNSNETNSMDGGEIYRLELDGTVLGKFGTRGQTAQGIRYGERDRLPQSE